MSDFFSALFLMLFGGLLGAAFTSFFGAVVRREVEAESFREGFLKGKRDGVTKRRNALQIVVGGGARLWQ